MKFAAVTLFTALLGSVPALSAPPVPPSPQVLQSIDVAPVWSGHPVGFSLLTDPKNHIQYVAYYNAQRQMTVASRRLDDTTWRSFPLHSESNSPQKQNDSVASTILGWDSHNSVVLALDSDGAVHLSGNMHASALLYFRTTVPGDISTLAQFNHIVGDRESNVTYPHFLTGPGGHLVFTYRDGHSGNGADIYDTYDVARHAWSRLLDQPLLDGQGHMNAYSTGPIKGPDGFFHLAWIWRDTPDCSTCHDISYARSRDLTHWENSDSQPLELPITAQTAEVVDPVPTHGGAINGNESLGFDPHNRPTIAFTKYDAAGNTQLYIARRDNSKWKIVQASDWNYRWNFSGGGTIVFDVRPSAPRVLPDGRFVVTFWHVKYGPGGFILNPQTLEPIGPYTPPPQIPPALEKCESNFPGMTVHTESDVGQSPDPAYRFILRWETLPANRDQPRTAPLPDPSMLRVYRISTMQNP